MAIDVPSAQGRLRPQRPSLWISFGLVLAWCAWLAMRDDEGAAAHIARPLTHGNGTASLAHSNSPKKDAMQERQLVASLKQTLAVSSMRADFPPLTDIGRQGWTSVEPTTAVASSSPVAAAAASAVPAVFPYQLVGMWTPTDKALGEADAQPLAIVAGSHSTWVVKQGDVLDVDWKVTSISTDQIQLTYLPTSSRQTIPMSKP